jgi:DNA-binding NarL/FixJ family response regulator
VDQRKKINGNAGLGMSLRILLADDHVIVRQGIRNLLMQAGYDVVGEATDGREAVQLARDLHPDIALLDLSMPLLNGIDAAREIRKVSCQTKPILLTMQNEGPYVTEAFRAGAKGYVLKTQGTGDLFEAIREVSRGSIYVSSSIPESALSTSVESVLPPDPLTPREREILQLIAEGKSSKEAADILGISFHTVESHRTRMMSKLAIHTRAGLVRYAIRQGLVQA